MLSNNVKPNKKTEQFLDRELLTPALCPKIKNAAQDRSKLSLFNFNSDPTKNADALQAHSD